MTADQCFLWTQQLRTRGIRAVAVEQHDTPHGDSPAHYCIVVPAPSGSRSTAYVLRTRAHVAAVLNLRQPKGCAILKESKQ